MRKKSLTLILALLVAFSSLCGCSDVLPFETKYETLSGTWRCTLQDSESEARGLLESIDAFEEEIAVADLTSLKFVKTVTFTVDKTYRFDYDIEGTKACVREFLDNYFNDLYDARITLNDAYGIDFGNMSRAEFLGFYADIYRFSDYNEMLDVLSENVYDYDRLARESIESGTYTIDGSYIMCTTKGSYKAEGMEYRIHDDSLTLIYVNGMEIYSKVN